MKELRGKEIRENVENEIQKRLEGKNISFFLYSDKNDSSSFYYLKSVKRVLDKFSIPYEEDFLKEDIEESLEIFERKAKNKYTILARPIKEESRFNALIDPLYDPDMCRIENAGKLFLGDLSFLPGTARSVYFFLTEYGIDVTGKKALVVGRSKTVGLPLFVLMEKLGATVTLCHSKSGRERIQEECKTSDIILLATGRKGIVERESLSPNKIVIDCGYSDNSGDLGFIPEENELLAYTPVPGGIGVLTPYGLVMNSCILEEINLQKNK